MADLLRRIRVELPITTFHGWHLADGVVQQFRLLRNFGVGGGKEVSAYRGVGVSAWALEK
jgi:hypothetical protein